MRGQRSFWDLIRASNGLFEATISGTSMEPTIPHGARVRIRPLVETEYREGQIVACALKDELFAHRIVFCADRAIVTQGDNRVLCDPPTAKREIIGLVEAYALDGSWVPPGASPTLPMRALGWANLVMVRACLAVHFELGRHVAGIALHIGRFIRMGMAATRHRSVPKA